MPNTLYIGIDPSGAKPEMYKREKKWKPGRIGLCMATSETDIIFFEGVNFFTFQSKTAEIVKLGDFDKAVAIVEDPDGQSVFHSRRSKMNAGQVKRAERDLGKNQCMTSHIIAWLEWIGIEDIIQVDPMTKGSKWSELTFRKWSKYTGPITASSQHAIDAYSMVWATIGERKGLSMR